VLDPVKVVIENYPEGQSEELEAINNPEDPDCGKRMVPFSRELYIEREDFMEDPPKKFFRLAPGREIRLRYAYFLTCREAIKNDIGEIIELRCSYDPETRGGNAPDGRKVKATLHWVSAEHAATAEIRSYSHLFTRPNPGTENDVIDDINPDSLMVMKGCQLEPSLVGVEPGQTVQFERLGYFCSDPEGTANKPVFNRTLGLRDTWAKIQKKSG